jgi:hypothetical protein
MRPLTFVYDDTGVLDKAPRDVTELLDDLLVMTESTQFEDDPIVLDAMPSIDHADDFMDRVIAMLTDVHVVFTMSALVGERADTKAALAEPLTRATLKLANLRRVHEAFGGNYEWDSDENGLIVEWVSETGTVRLHVPDPRDGNDFTLVVKGVSGDFSWTSFAEIAAGE